MQELTSIEPEIEVKNDADEYSAEEPPPSSDGLARMLCYLEELVAASSEECNTDPDHQVASDALRGVLRLEKLSHLSWRPRLALLRSVLVTAVAGADGPGSDAKQALAVCDLMAAASDDEEARPA